MERFLGPETLFRPDMVTSEPAQPLPEARPTERLTKSRFKDLALFDAAKSCGNDTPLLIVVLAQPAGSAEHGVAHTSNATLYQLAWCGLVLTSSTRADGGCLHSELPHRHAKGTVQQHRAERAPLGTSCPCMLITMRLTQSCKAWQPNISACACIDRAISVRINCCHLLSFVCITGRYNHVQELWYASATRHPGEKPGLMTCEPLYRHEYADFACPVKAQTPA